MASELLFRILEHNNWANLGFIRACRALRDDQLDAKPLSPDRWTIRENLIHLVECQQGYLLLLTLPPEDRHNPPLTFSKLEESARSSGEALLELLRQAQQDLAEPLFTTDGYRVQPWVVINQVIHHGIEHRKQVATLMRELGVDPPRSDGWEFGLECGALVPIT